MKTKYTIANNSKRIMALIVDAAIAFVLALLLNSFVAQKFIAPAMGSTDLGNKAFAYMNDSKLFDNPPDSDGNYSYSSLQLFEYSAQPTEKQEKCGYEYYLDATWEYYTDFLRLDDRAEHLPGLTSKVDYASYFFSDVMNFRAPDLTKVYATDEEPDSNNLFFTYALNDEGKIDLEKKPVVHAHLLKSDGTLSDENAAKLKDFFFKTDSSEMAGIYYTAAYELAQTPYFADLNQELTRINWLGFVMMYAPVAIIIYYVIPVLVPNGKSIGKLIAKTSVAGVGGVKLKPLQRFLRPLAMTVISMAMIIPNNLIGIMVFAALCALDYAASLIKKTDQVGHDLLFKTIVVDDNGLELFATKEEADAYIEEEKAKEPERKTYDNSSVNLHVED